MMEKSTLFAAVATLALINAPAPAPARAHAGMAALAPATMPHVATVDERFQSYNIEMVEVTGGRFWKPYDQLGSRRAARARPVSSRSSSGPTPTDMDPSLFEYRAPLDLSNHRLRAMAHALAPAYVRVSGTWANTTYFADTETPPSAPPPGYGAVLTRDQWRGVIAFSRAVDAPIVTSMPTGAGTRGADGLWRPDQARRWLDFTRANGGTIAAAEFMNEPTLAAMGGAPQGYDAAAYGRDHRAFATFMRAEHPGTRLLAPGSVGEADAPWAVAIAGYGAQSNLPAALLAAQTGDADIFSYHHYGAASQRCASVGAPGTSADQALSEDWLGRTDATLAYYRRVRDRAMPGKPLWNTETGETACGGNPWARTFLDTFRYLDQLGRLARQGVQVVMHNTLAASDYALLDERTFAPRPSYWGALLWRRLMGTAVLDAGVPIHAGLHVYAHCLRGFPGGVAILALNTDRHRTVRIGMPLPAQRYTFTAASLTDEVVSMNGTPLHLGPEDTLPLMAGVVTTPGAISLAPATITFLAVPYAHNAACR